MSNNKPLNSHVGINERRVFVVGAGFSSCAGLPLSGNFFSELMKFMKEIPDRKIKHLREQLRLFAFLHLSSKTGWKTFKTESWHKEINLEHLLTIAETSAEIWDALFAKRNKYMMMMKYTVEHYVEYFKGSIALFIYSKQLKSMSSATTILNFCKHLKYGDTIISFNWDTLIENATQILHKRLKDGIGDKKSVGLLKLHGSIDWISNVRGNRRINKYIKPINKTVSRIIDFPAFMNTDISKYVPYLIPPTAYKRYDPWIISFWSQANESLFYASKIFIIGYSMPMTDWASLSLLRLPFRPEITNNSRNKPRQKRLYIINPDHSITLKFKQKVSSKAIGIYKSFNDVDWKNLS